MPAYVRKTGSDANGGTSPADAWLTINHALQTAAPGSVIYVGAGVYRETVQVTIVPTPSLPVFVVGDVDGAFTGDAGIVQLTAYTTSDIVAPSGTALLDLNGQSNIAFQNIFYVGGSAAMVLGTTGLSQQILFRDCGFLLPGISGARLTSATSTYGLPLNWLFDRCLVLAGNAALNPFLVNVTGSAVAGNDYDIYFTIRNAVILSSAATAVVFQNPTGGTASNGGGIRLRSSFILTAGGVLSAGANSSLRFPATAYGCILMSGSTTLSAVTSGALIEDYNVIVASAARSSVPVGIHSVSNGSRALLLHFGQERIWGGYPRPFGEAMAGSPLADFGSLDTLAGFTDARKGPRQQSPAAWDLGPYMRGNNFIKETGTVHTGSNAISLTGNGFQDFDLAVDAGTLTVSIYCQRDANYTGQPPQLQILQNEAVGVGTNTIDFTPGSIAAWEQQSLTITPTAKGVVTVRVVSNDTSGIAKTVFDTFAAA